jgi:integrase
MTSTSRPYTSLIEFTSSSKTERLSAAVRLIIAHRISLYIKPPAHGTCLVHRFRRTPHFPTGSWETFDSKRGADYDFVEIDTSVIELDESGRFVTDIAYLGSGNDRLKLWFDAEFPVSPHQLFVPTNLPENISAAIRQLTTSSQGSGLTSPEHTHQKSELLSKEIETYCTHKSTAVGGNKDNTAWTEKTASEFRMILETFLTMVGDKEVLALTNADYDQFMSGLRNLPPNRRKDKRYRDLDVKTIIALKPEKVISEKTVKQYHGVITAFTAWLASRHGPKFNNSIKDMLKGAGSKKQRSLKEPARLPFTSKHLTLMFESKESLEFLSNATHPYQAWLPVLGLHTGARLNEICSLRIADIISHQSRHYIDINEKEDSNKRLKTANSIRRIPMHQTLVQLGLPEFAEWMRGQPEKKTEGRLFPECNYVKGHGYKKAASRWFNEKFLEHLGIVEPQYVFHSYRHVISNVLNRVDGLQQWRISAYLGHEIGPDAPESVKSYLATESWTDLLPVLDALKFSINWSQYETLTRRTFRSS